MVESGNGGRVINVASVAGICAALANGAAHYSATKGAIINMTKVWD